MTGLLFKLIPTLWPFLKEVFGGGNKRTRGGHKSTPVFRYIAIFTIIYLVSGVVVFDVIKTLYTANQGYLVTTATLKQSEVESKGRIQALEAENNTLKMINIAHERDLSAANAKAAFAESERVRLTDENRDLRARR